MIKNHPGSQWPKAKAANKTTYAQFKQYVIETGETRTNKLHEKFKINCYRIDELFSLMEEQGLVSKKVAKNIPRRVL